MISCVLILALVIAATPAYSHAMELVNLLQRVSTRLHERTGDGEEKQTCNIRHFGLKQIYLRNIKKW